MYTRQTDACMQNTIIHAPVLCPNKLHAISYTHTNKFSVQCLLQSLIYYFLLFFFLVFMWVIWFHCWEKQHLLKKEWKNSRLISFTCSKHMHSFSRQFPFFHSEPIKDNITCGETEHDWVTYFLKHTDI